MENREDGENRADSGNGVDRAVMSSPYHPYFPYYPYRPNLITHY